MGKILNKIKFYFALLFHGLKAADNEIFTTVDSSNDSQSISQKITTDTVYDDLLAGKETQRVIELRDEYYRILLEADKYHVDVTPIIDSNGEVVDFKDVKTRRKNVTDFIKRCDVDESDGNKIRVIQDNEHILKKSLLSATPEDVMNSSMFDYETTLTIERDKFRPSVLVEKFITKIVVKNINEHEALIDLYMPTKASQFGKVDAIVVSKINDLFKNKVTKTPLFDFKTLSFITNDKCFNSPQLCEFKYDNLSLQEIIIYDGNFVVRMKGNILSDGTSIVDKFKTKEVDSKYENKEAKGEATNIFAAYKKVKEEQNLNNEITSLEEVKL